MQYSRTITLPRLPAAHEIKALLAGTTFLDMTAETTVGVGPVADWFEEHVLGEKVMNRPVVVVENEVGSVPLVRALAGRGGADASMGRVVSHARAKVVDSLRRYIRGNDDRFLRSNIFQGRVRREDGRWVARPEANAPLSSIVLSFFSVAMLSDRAYYDRELCVCEACGRVAFDARDPQRNVCPYHRPPSVRRPRNEPGRVDTMGWRSPSLREQPTAPSGAQIRAQAAAGLRERETAPTRVEPSRDRERERETDPAPLSRMMGDRPTSYAMNDSGRRTTSLVGLPRAK